MCALPNYQYANLAKACKKATSIEYTRQITCRVLKNERIDNWITSLTAYWCSMKTEILGKELWRVTEYRTTILPLLYTTCSVKQPLSFLEAVNLIIRLLYKGIT